MTKLVCSDNVRCPEHGMEPVDLAQRLGIKPIELDRETAASRHMEKVRGELREGRKYILLW